MNAPDPAKKVYLDYTQAELDRAYDQRAWVSNADELIAAKAAASARTRERFAHRAGVAYGPGPDETLDIFPAASARGPAPVHVHVHGGSWRTQTRSDVSLLADVLVPAGAIYVALNFSTIPKVRIPDMIAQIRRAIAWVHANAASFGGDPDRMHLSGHSSGGHLAGVLMTTDWAAHGLPADVLKSGLLASGMYDMRPVMLSARSDYVKLSAAEVLDLSAILHIDRLCAPISIFYGSNETPEFQRQPIAFAAAVRDAGKAAPVTKIPGRNHFEMMGEFGDPASPVAKEALRLMGLGG